MFRELPPTAGMPVSWQDLCELFNSSKNSFESELAQFLKIQEPIIVSSGTYALRLIFEASKNLTGRNKVIIPGYTCPLVAIAAHLAGLEIIPCDLRQNSFEMDFTKLVELCDETILAIVPTHLGGQLAKVDKILELANSCGAFVIEDAAQSLGAQFFDGVFAGTKGQVGIYSLAPGKGMSLYDGGIIVCKDAALRDEISRLRMRNSAKNYFLELERIIQFLAYSLFYNPFGLYFVYGLSLRFHLSKNDFIKAVGEEFDIHTSIFAYDFLEFRKRVGAKIVKERLSEFINANRARAQQIIDNFQARQITKNSKLRLVTGETGSKPTWPFYMLICESKIDRDQILNRLWTKGLGLTRLFINEIDNYPYLNNIVPKSKLVYAKDFAERSFTISNTHWMLDSEIEAIFDTVCQTISANS